MTLPKLDAIALFYLQLPGLQRIGAIYGLMVVGGVVGGLVWRGDATLNRSRYFFGLGGIAFFIGLSQAWWLLIGKAMAAGLGYLPVLADMGSTVLYGMFLAWLAKARSRDIAGDTGEAWKAFMPPIGLWLVGKRGHDTTHFAANLPFWIIGVVLIFLGRVSGTMIAQEVNHGVQQETAFPLLSAQASQATPSSGDLKTDLNDIIAGTGVPAIVGNGLILTKVTREDLHLTYHFTYDKLAPGADDTVTAETLVSHFCAVHKAQIAIGATMTLEFIGAGAPSVSPVDLSAATCAS